MYLVIPDISDRKAYIRKMREKMANEIQAKSVTIPLAELQSERESISLAHSRPKTPDRSAIFTAKLGSTVNRCRREWDILATVFWARR